MSRPVFVLLMLATAASVAVAQRPSVQANAPIDSASSWLLGRQLYAAPYWTQLGVVPPTTTMTRPKPTFAWRSATTGVVRVASPTVVSELQCPMPVSRLDSNAVALMPRADVRRTEFSGISVAGCVNPLNRR